MKTEMTLSWMNILVGTLIRFAFNVHNLHGFKKVLYEMKNKLYPSQSIKSSNENNYITLNEIYFIPVE